MPTEKRLTPQERRHKRHLHTVSAKLRNKEYQRFQDACAAAGLTPYRAIQDFCKDVAAGDLALYRQSHHARTIKRDL